MTLSEKFNISKFSSKFLVFPQNFGDARGGFSHLWEGEVQIFRVGPENAARADRPPRFATGFGCIRPPHAAPSIRAINILGLDICEI